MKNNDPRGAVVLVFFAVLVALVNFFIANWKIILALVIVGFILYIIFSGEETSQNDSTEDEVTQAESKLPPMPYDAIESAKIARARQIFDESYELVQTSDNIVTVNNRFGDCLQFAHQLQNAVAAEIFDEAGKVVLFNRAVDRYLARQFSEIQNLKTERGKKNRVGKILQTIESLGYMPHESKLYAKRKVEELSAEKIFNA